MSSALAKGLYSTSHGNPRKPTVPNSSGAISSRKLEQLTEDKHVRSLYQYMTDKYGLKLTYIEFISLMIRLMS